jgi:hypothetical protein
MYEVVAPGRFDMEIGPENEARVQIDDEKPFAIRHAVIERDGLQSRLRRLTLEDGGSVVLPVGARVTLYEGPSVVFVGVVEEDQSVIDLLSAQMDDTEEFESI